MIQYKQLPYQPTRFPDPAINVLHKVMYGCESWTIKKAEHWRIYALELWYWRRLLRVPWTARRFNQSILKEISPGCSLDDWCWSWNSNTLATRWEELTHLKRPWCWERLKAGGEGDDRGWDGWMASPTRWTWVWVNSRSCWWTGRPGILQFMGSQRVGHNWATELNWTDEYISLKLFIYTSTNIQWVPIVKQTAFHSIGELNSLWISENLYSDSLLPYLGREGWTKKHS